MDLYAELRRMEEEGQRIAALWQQERQSERYRRAFELNPVVELLANEYDRLASQLAASAKRTFSLAQKIDRKLLAKEEDLNHQFMVGRLQNQILRVCDALQRELAFTEQNHDELAQRAMTLTSMEEAGRKALAELADLRAQNAELERRNADLAEQVERLRREE